MKIIAAKELKLEHLKPCVDNHGREWAIDASDVYIHARMDDGTERKAVQRVLFASISTPELTMTVEVGQTQEDYHAQLRSIFNAHGPGKQHKEKSDE